MSLRTVIFRKIRQINDPNIDKAMSDALTSASPHDQRLLTYALLERKQPEGTLGLVRSFHLLPPDIQQMVTEQVSNLYPALRASAQNRQTHDPHNVIEIIRRSHATRLAYLLGDQLVHGSPALRQEAGATLLEMAHAWTSMADGHSVAYLQAAIEEAVGVYQSHQQKQVLLALAAMAPRPIPRTLTFLSAPTHRYTVDVLRLMVQRTDQPEIARTLLSLLVHDDLKTDVLIGLKRALRGPYLEQVLVGAHLLRMGRVEQVLQRIQDGSGWLPSGEKVSSLAGPRRKSLIWLSHALPGALKDKVAYAKGLQPHLDRSGRLTVLRHLMNLSRRDTTGHCLDAISEFCFDPEASLARIALAHLIFSQWSSLLHLLVQLVNGEHAGLSQIAMTRLAPLTYQKLWRSWPRLDSAQRLEAGKAQIKIDPRFLARLGQHLRSDQTDQLRALSMIRDLNQGVAFEQTLIRMARSADLKLAASAVRALSTSGSPRAIDLLEHCLNHRDDRVRANAVESLQQTDVKQHARRLLRMTQQDTNRARANAIGALLPSRPTVALVALDEMLCDTRKNHRRSALWLVDVLGLSRLSTRVAEMSITDPEPVIRKRAHHVIHRLIDSMETDPRRSVTTNRAVAA